MLDICVTEQPMGLLRTRFWKASVSYGIERKCDRHDNVLMCCVGVIDDARIWCD